MYVPGTSLFIHFIILKMQALCQPQDLFRQLVITCTYIVYACIYIVYTCTLLVHQPQILNACSAMVFFTANASVPPPGSYIQCYRTGISNSVYSLFRQVRLAARAERPGGFGTCVPGTQKRPRHTPPFHNSHKGIADLGPSQRLRSSLVPNPSGPRDPGIRLILPHVKPSHRTTRPRVHHGNIKGT